MPKVSAIQFVRSGVSQGWSANRAYQEYVQTARDLTAETGERWTAQRRQDFLRTYAQTLAHRSQILDAIQRPKDRVPLGAEITQRDTVKARGYGQWVMLAQRTRGESDYILTPHLIKTSQPITPAEAEARVRGMADRDENNYNRTTLAVFYTGTEEFVPQGG